jgi:hypothetical protein
MTKKRLRQIGGGTNITSKSRHPSDDDFEGKTPSGRRILYRFFSTINAHFSMPHQIDSIREVLVLPGVSREYYVFYEGGRRVKRTYEGSKKRM